MKESLERLKNKALEEIKKINDPKLLSELEKEYLGRKGELTKILRQIKDISEDLKPVVGRLANEVKRDLSSALKEAEIKLKKGAKPASGFFDPTLPGITAPQGHLHPITQMLEGIWDVFRSMNYDIVTGPEIETDYYNFQSLNIPLGHPARDMHDTFYVGKAGGAKREEGGQGDLLLRTHTTASQLHFMKNHRPPFRVISTGKCYRRDSDVSHTPMFHQFDGFAVDQDITMADLKGTLKAAMSKLLAKEIEIRFRVSYFPFVEPGAEFDVSCALCDGKGCPTCKYTGWLEMGAGGMIHPKVLSEGGIDPKKWRGFAFGFGVERPLMIKHKISDLRLFFENDLRFLSQF